MKSRPSLTLRLALFFGAGSTVVLVVLGYLVSISVQRHFIEIDREDLLAKVELVRHIVESAATPEALRQIPARTADALTGHHRISLRMTDAGGQLIYVSPSASFPPALFPAGIADGDIANPPIRSWRADGHAFRGTQVAIRTASGDGSAYGIALAIGIDHHVAFLDAFDRGLWISIAIGILVTTGLGWVAARRGLTPVREMAVLAQSISVSRLHDRLDVDAQPRELVDLARAFNDMLARLEGSFQRLSAFSSDLAHELQTPLSNVMTQTQVALSRGRSVEEYREVLYSSLEECDRLARTIADMLFIAKADHGLMLPRTEPIGVAAEINALFEFYDALAEECSVGLKCVGDGTWYGDRLMIRRALGNLLSNAIAHAAPGTDVYVRIENAKTGVATVQVENRGETIAPEHLPRLFDRFYRVDPARQRATGGAGLGLAITKSIVEAHRGELSVTSIDGVTIFSMTLDGTMNGPPADSPLVVPGAAG